MGSYPRASIRNLLLFSPSITYILLAFGNFCGREITLSCSSSNESEPANIVIFVYLYLSAKQTCNP